MFIHLSFFSEKEETERKTGRKENRWRYRGGERGHKETSTGDRKRQRQKKTETDLKYHCCKLLRKKSCNKISSKQTHACMHACIKVLHFLFEAHRMHAPMRACTEATKHARISISRPLCLPHCMHACMLLRACIDACVRRCMHACSDECMHAPMNAFNDFACMRQVAAKLQVLCMQTVDNISSKKSESQILKYQP